MAKPSFVLRALKILGLEDVIKLSEVLHVKQVPLKKAAGEELIVWDNAGEDKHQKGHPQNHKEAKVLEFLKNNASKLQPIYEEAHQVTEEDETDKPEVLPTDLLLLQREIAKSNEGTVQKMGAFKGYKKSTEMYTVKTSTPEGKDKIRFASTNGVLVDKKQA